ncbi:arylamine N-acetyltransferase [bacterium]|nr:MAG: arylamine N-acetyltransferase [bacterium]
MIDDYLQRLGLDRPAHADLAALSLLQATHQQRIPFENIDIIAGQPLSLEPDHLSDKLLHRGRGGFCYELNSMFARLLEQLGFQVTLLSAGVFNGEGVPGLPFDHLCLRVDLDQGPYLCDVGFGRAAVHPLPLRAAESITDAAGEFRLRELDQAEAKFGPPSWLLSRHAPDNPRTDADGWMPLFLFDLQPRALSDFDAMFRWHQSSPDSVFPGTLILTQAKANGRVSIRGQKWQRLEDGRESTGEFKNASARREMAREEFGVELSAELDDRG